MRPVAAVALCVLGGAGLTLFALLRAPTVEGDRATEHAEAPALPQLRRLSAERPTADIASDTSGSAALANDERLARAEASEDEDIRRIARLARLTTSASLSDRLRAADTLVDAAELRAVLGFDPQPHLDRLARDPEVRVQKRLLQRVVAPNLSVPRFDTRTRRETLIALSGSSNSEVRERALTAIDSYGERRPAAGALDTAAGRRSWVSSAAAPPVTSTADGWRVIDVELPRWKPGPVIPPSTYRVTRAADASLRVWRHLGEQRVRIWHRPMPAGARLRVFPYGLI